MDFTIEDNDWIVDKDTDRLSYELFGGLVASNNSKSLRSRKRKRVKATSQGNILQKESSLISLQSDKSSRNHCSLKKHASLSNKIKKGKRKINSHSLESAITSVNKHQKANNSDSELQRVNTHSVDNEKKLKKVKKRKKPLKQSIKYFTADSVEKVLCNRKDKSSLTTSKLCRIQLKGKHKKYSVDSSIVKLKNKTTNNARNKLCNSVSQDKMFSSPQQSNWFPQLKIKKLKAILESAPPLYKVNQNLQMKDRRKGTLILEKGKRKEYSDIVKERAEKKLKSARFRFINEKMYTATGKESLNLFKVDPDAFEIYHEGFQEQVDKWPLNPADVIINDISKMSKTLKIADFGCGNAKIAQAFPDREVISFDFISMNDYVTACDMANVPLTKESIDIAIFCLALMGTNLNDYLCEAHRVLKMGGQLKIAEVISRMENAETFINNLKKFGFTLLKKNVTHKMFIFLHFRKTGKLDKTKLPVIVLKPCLYKRR